jgi:hypothetical protein
MRPISSREVVVSLHYVSLPVLSDGLGPVSCLNCSKTLDVHQPDADLPYRMLATCPECKRWHLVDCDPEAPRARITLLPDAALNGVGSFD